MNKTWLTQKQIIKESTETHNAEGVELKRKLLNTNGNASNLYKEPPKIENLLKSDSKKFLKIKEMVDLYSW